VDSNSDCAGTEDAARRVLYEDLEPEKIVAADRDFVRKLHELRSKLAVRQKHQILRKCRRVFHRPATLIVTLLIIAGAGLALMHRKPDLPPAASGDPAVQTDGVQAALPATDYHAARPRPEVSDGSGVAEALETPSHIMSSGTPSGRSSVAAEEPLEIKKQSAPVANSSPAKATPGPAEENIELLSAVVCAGVRERRHQDEKEVFYLSDAPRAYVWMEVRSAAQPAVMKHMYYLNGRKYCEVPLKVKYSHMRTWSYVTLWKAAQAGSWTVDIVCRDRILKTVAFQVLLEKGERSASP
jgi:hypothetical protein